MPWFVILKDPHMDWPTKFQLGAILMLVVGNLVTNIVRTVYTEKHDLTVDPHVNAICTIMQITVAVIICALPAYGRHLTADKFNKVLEPFKKALQPFKQLFQIFKQWWSRFTHFTLEKSRLVRQKYRERFPRKSGSQGVTEGDNGSGSAGQVSIPLQELRPKNDGRVVGSDSMFQRDRAAPDNMV